MSDIFNAVTAIASLVSALGVLVALLQLRLAHNLATTQFEDLLSREYRDVISRLPSKAILGKKLTKAEHRMSRDEFFQSFDLSNQQAFLRQQGRVGDNTWRSWSEGIRSNLNRPAFCPSMERNKFKIRLLSRIEKP